MMIMKLVISKFKREGLFGLLIAIIKHPFKRIARNRSYKEMLNKGSIAERFGDIYDKKFWSSEGTASGEGSEIEYTENLRNWLIHNLPGLNIKTFVDAPCGDFNWMKEVLPYIDVDYIGLDIVQSVIEKNKKNYQKKNIRFEVANICEDKLPQCDLIMVRDCLFHLSYEDINSFLKNLSGVNYKYLLTTTHVVSVDFRNSDIITGDFRIIDVFSHPFDFQRKNVIDYVEDYPIGHSIPRHMILLEKRFVPKSLSL